MIRTRARILVGSLLLALPVVAGACDQGPNVPVGPQPSAASAAPGNVGATVTLLYSSFEPSAVTIKQGQQVEWIWKDAPNPHDVYVRDYVNANGQPDPIVSPVQQQGTWYQTFDKPGTYHYSCTLHSEMSGVIVVLPAGSTGPTGATGGGVGTTGLTGSNETGAGISGATGATPTGVSGSTGVTGATGSTTSTSVASTTGTTGTTSSTG
jgi:plastocyanin